MTENASHEPNKLHNKAVKEASNTEKQTNKQT